VIKYFFGVSVTRRKYDAQTFGRDTLWGRNELAKKKFIFQFRVRFLT
jgi:hypothetical protein